MRIALVAESFFPAVDGTTTTVKAVVEGLTELYLGVLDPKTRVAAEKAGFVLSGEPAGLMSFDFGDHWQLHHAAPFAPVRWTNIYDPAHLVFFGDIISGLVAPAFGPAVRDVNLEQLRGGPSLGFTHTAYWARPEDRSRAATVRIAALREALDLAGDTL